MNQEWMLWLVCGLLAGAALLRMMRRRQLVLIGLLKSYVDRQAQWNRRRAKAAAIAAAEEVRLAEKAAKAALAAQAIQEDQDVQAVQNAHETEIPITA